MSNRRALSNAVKESKQPKQLSKPKDMILDPMGQWKHPGENTRIPSNNITMEGVPYPVLAKPNVGQPVMMQPGAHYTFPGADYVDEFPKFAGGGTQEDPGDGWKEVYLQELNEKLANGSITQKQYNYLKAKIDEYYNIEDQIGGLRKQLVSKQLPEDKFTEQYQALRGVYKQKYNENHGCQPGMKNCPSDEELDKLYPTETREKVLVGNNEVTKYNDQGEIVTTVEPIYDYVDKETEPVIEDKEPEIQYEKPKLELEKPGLEDYDFPKEDYSTKKKKHLIWQLNQRNNTQPLVKWGTKIVSRKEDPLLRFVTGYDRAKKNSKLYKEHREWDDRFKKELGKINSNPEDVKFPSFRGIPVASWEDLKDRRQYKKDYKDYIKNELPGLIERNKHAEAEYDQELLEYYKLTGKKPEEQLETDKYGGSTEEYRRGGGLKSKKYSRSLQATNKFFREHSFFEKAKKLSKKRIYDPSAYYFQDGGENDCPKGYIKDDNGNCVWHDPAQENSIIDKSAIHPVEYSRSQLTMGDPFYNTHTVALNDKDQATWQLKNEDQIKTNLRNTTLKNFIQRHPMDSSGLELGYLHNNIWTSPTLGLEKDTLESSYAPNQLSFERDGKHPNVYFIKNDVKGSAEAPSHTYASAFQVHGNKDLSKNNAYNKVSNDLGKALLEKGYKGENMWGKDDEDQLIQLYGTEGSTLKGATEITPETLKYLQSIKDSEEGKRHLAKLAGISEDDPDYADMLMHYNTTPIDVYAETARPENNDLIRTEEEIPEEQTFLRNTEGPVNYKKGGEPPYNNLPPTYLTALQNFVYPNVKDDPERTGYNSVNNTISYDSQSPIENMDNKWWMEHELFHDLQNQAGGMSTSGVVGQRPNSYAASDESMQGYYNRRDADVERTIDRMIAQDPNLQFIPRNKLAEGAGPGFIGAEDLQYADPTTVEGEARQYEQYIREGNPSIFPNRKYGGSLDTYAGGGEYGCADDEKWDEAKQKCVKIVQNLSESTHYDPAGKKIQTNLFQKLKDAKDAYQNFTKQHRGKKYRLNEADSASSIEQLIKGIQLYKDEYAKEQESTRAELKKLENLKSKAALKNNKDIQNLSLKDLNTVKGKMKIEDAIRNSDLDSGTIAALYKGFNLDAVDRNVMKEGYKGQWQDAVNEANARKEANMGITNTALELFGGGAYRVAADPLGTLKGVGQTVGDIATLPFGLATGVYNYATDGNFDMGTNAWGDSYGKGLSQTGDLLSAIPGLGAAGKLAKFTKAADLAGDIGKGFKTIGTKLDQKIYPTRAYRSEGFAVDPERFSTTDNATKQLAEKVGKKGDWATKDLEETYQYLRGLGFDESQGLLSGKNVKFTEYKLPFWKKDISADPDVIALKKLQGTKINSNEYIVPGNTALDRFLYPRRTNIIKGIPEHVKSQKIYPSKFPEGIQTYYKGTIPMNVESETLSSPAYKYVEDQLNAVTGHEMPITHEWNSNYFPIKDWQQPQFAPNKGVGKFTRFSSSLPGSPNASISGRLKQFFDRPPGPMMLLGPSGGTNMVKKNIPYYEQLLNTYDSKVMSATNKKFYKDLINTAKMQDGMLTEAQLRELDRLKTGNFDFGKKGYAKGGTTNDYIEMDIPKSKVQWYIDNGYDVEVLE
jgi:hypothetical protein